MSQSKDDEDDTLQDIKKLIKIESLPQSKDLSDQELDILKKITQKNYLFIKISDQLVDEDQLRQEAHDLRGAFRTLSLLLENLEKGYKFDDERAPLKIEAFKKSLTKLEQYQSVLDEILSFSNK